MRLRRRTLLLGFPGLVCAAGKLDEAFAVAQASSPNGGLVIVRSGEVLFERYFGKGSREAAPSAGSCGAGVTSIAAGILVSERPYLFPNGLDQKMFTVRHLPKEAFPLHDPRKAGIKLGQLLSMTSGLRGRSPGYVLREPVEVDPAGPDGPRACVDAAAAATGMWCSPGSGFSYAAAGVHIVSMMIRRITGMEIEAYIADRLAGPLGWTNMPDGGGILAGSRDMIRFGEMLLGQGRWGGKQIAPADFVKACGGLSPYNPHCAYSLCFDVNGDGHVPNVPRDAFWMTGAGGHCLFVIPSMELVIWKMGDGDSVAGRAPEISHDAAAIRVLQLTVAAHPI